MLSVVSMSKAFRIVMMLALALSLAGAVFVLSPEENAAGQVEPLAVITVEVDPAPPDYIVNDGTMTQRVRWTIEFQSTPDHYTFVIKTYPGDVPVAGTFMNVDISGEPTPGTVHNPEWTGYHEWDVPLGQAAGSYIARVEYFSNVGFEQGGESVFYINDKAHLTAVITAPADGSTYNTCTDFTVTATVSNTGEADALGVSATIDTGATASLKAGETATKDLGDIPGGGGPVSVSWDLHCDDPGDSVITVDPTGTDGTSGEAILEENTDEAQITVHQVLKAHLTAVITAPADGSTYNTCTDFTVTATVSNTGEADALGVSATIDTGATASLKAGETATKDLGDIPGGGGPVSVSWDLHCDDPGDSIITVDPTGTDANTGLEIIEGNTDEAQITVHQVLKAHLTAVITAPADGSTYNTCTDFTVTATVSNTGEADALGVTATIDTGATASLKAGEIATKDLGDIPAGGGPVSVSWDLHCDDPGDSIITVDPTGTDANTGLEIIEDNTDEASITVHQVLKAHLTAVITAPPDGSTYNTCTDFTVTATVSNTGEADALGVSATIDTGATASLKAGETATKDLGDIPAGGGPVSVSWDLHCDDPGDSIITVDPTGTDANTGVEIIEDNTDEASITVHQQLKAHLAAAITAPADGSTYDTSTNFTVTATVTNPGQATAEDVTATISIDANASLVAGEQATKSLGDIPGGGGPVTVSWRVHCDSEGDSVLTVDPTGIDANTGVEVIEDNTDEANITVHQKPPPPMVPSVSQWGIIAMVAVFGVLLVWAGRRRLANRGTKA